MNIKELALSITKTELALNAIQAENIIRDIFSSIEKELSNNKEINIPGFGKFYTQEQAGRSGTAPDGTKWTTETKQVPKFKAAKALKDKVA